MRIYDWLSDDYDKMDIILNYIQKYDCVVNSAILDEYETVKTILVYCGSGDLIYFIDFMKTGGVDYSIGLGDFMCDGFDMETFLHIIIRDDTINNILI